MTMIDTVDYAQIKDYFGQKLAEFGPTVRGIDWNSDAAQTIRYEQVCKVIQGKEPFSINDYGCGYGALVDFLRKQGLTFTYAGFDLLQPMVTAAQGKYGADPALTFTADETLLPVADYTVLSGIFNVKQNVSETAWRDYMIDILHRVDQMSKQGFAFNALTSYSDPERMRPDLYYADPCFFFDYCKRHFAKNVALLHDYILYDFTIIVRKQVR